MIRCTIRFVLFLILIHESFVFAAPGPLFNVLSSGTALNGSVTLCTNAYAPINCQNYAISGVTLSISTNVPNFCYPFVGIKSMTPGLGISSAGSCTPLSNGYCMFSLCNTSTKQISVNTYTVGGTITGLSGTGLILQNNGGDDLAVSAGSTSFVFNTSIAPAGSYNVTILQQPTGQSCTVNNGSGSNVFSNVTNINITCSVLTYTIGGTVSGLTGAGLVLQNNGGDDLPISAGASSFQFSTPVDYGGSYAVAISQQPAGQTCTIVNVSGLNVTANVTTIGVYCQWAYTANVSGNTLSLVDRVGHTVVGTISGFSAPWGVAVRPNNPTLYVTNISSNSVSVVDIATNTIIGSIALPASTGPQGIVFTPDGSKAYTANFGNNTVSVINATTQTVSTNITVGTQPYDLATRPDGARVYVSNSGGGSVSVINTTTDTVVTTIAGFNGPRGLAANPNQVTHPEVYVANRDLSNVKVVSTASNTIIATISEPVGGGTLPFAVAFTIDGATGYVTNAGAPNNGPLMIINTTTRVVTNGPALGANERGAAVSLDGTQLLLTQLNVNNLYTIDTSTNLLTATTGVGANPFAIATN